MLHQGKKSLQLPEKTLKRDWAEKKAVVADVRWNQRNCKAYATRRSKTNKYQYGQGKTGFLFVKPPCFVGFSLFFMVFELKIGGRRESQRLRVGELARGTNGRWPKGKAMGISNETQSAIIPMGFPRKARLQKNKLETTEKYLPTIRNYCREIIFYCREINSNSLENFETQKAMPSAASERQRSEPGIANGLREKRMSQI